MTKSELYSIARSLTACQLLIALSCENTRRIAIELFNDDYRKLYRRKPKVHSPVFAISERSVTGRIGVNRNYLSIDTSWVLSHPKLVESIVSDLVKQKLMQ